MEKRHLVLLGILTGVLSSYLGIGGGIIIVPVLAVFFKYPIKKAVGTSLAVLPLTAITGCLIHFHIMGMGVSGVSILLVSGSAIFGARVGVYFSEIIKSKYIKMGFAVFLFYAGLKQLGLVNVVGTEFTNCSSWGSFVVLGLVAGVSSSLLGIGGGIVMVPALNMLFGFSVHESIMMSLAVIIPTSIAGTYFHAKNKNVDFSVLKHIIPGAMFGAFVGAVLSNISLAEDLQEFLGFLLILMSIKMIFLCLQQK